MVKRLGWVLHQELAALRYLHPKHFQDSHICSLSMEVLTKGTISASLAVEGMAIEGAGRRKASKQQTGDPATKRGRYVSRAW